MTRIRPYHDWILEKGHVGADVAILARQSGGNDQPHSSHVELDSAPTFFKNIIQKCLHRDVLHRPLAMVVAEDLRRELDMLKRNFG